MERAFLSFLLLLLFSSCEYNNITKNLDPNNILYAPYLISIRSNHKVTLQWGRPVCPMCGMCICPQLEPDHFEILMSSDSPSDLKVHSYVSNNIFEVSISNLTNGKPYYFAIKAIGSNESTQSETIMTIPDVEESIHTIFTTINKNSEMGTWSPDHSSIAYVSDYLWNNGNNSAQSVFIYNHLLNKEHLVEKNSSFPTWSASGKKITYHSDNGEINTSSGYRPTHIAVYNLQDSTIKRLTSGNTFDFLPTFSSDEKWIAFLSDKAKGNEFNIWKIPSDSGAAIQVTSDFNDLNELGIIDSRSPKTLSWSGDGSIAFARLTKTNLGYNCDIYSIPSTGGSRTILVTSPWEDTCPAFSPDGTLIAFVSNRSGSNELWTMDLKTKKLNQITGKGKWIFETPGKIEWSKLGDKILYTSYSDNFKTLYSVDIKI